MLSLDTAYRSFGGEVEASSTPTMCRLSDSRRHQLWAIALGHSEAIHCAAKGHSGAILVNNQRHYETAGASALREAKTIRTMLGDFDRTRQLLDGDIAAQEERARISDDPTPSIRFWRGR
jgi:hypothetical protein